MNKTILSLGLGMLTGSQNGAMAVHVVSPAPASFLQIQKKKGAYSSPQATVPFLVDFNRAGKIYTIRWNADKTKFSLENVITGDPTPVQPLDPTDMDDIARALTESGIFDVNLVDEADYSIRFYFRMLNTRIFPGDAIISEREDPSAPERLDEDPFGLRADNESDDEDGVAPNALNLSSASGRSALDRGVIMLNAFRLNNSFSDNSDIMNQSEDSVSFHLASPASVPAAGNATLCADVLQRYNAEEEARFRRSHGLEQSSNPSASSPVTNALTRTMSQLTNSSTSAEFLEHLQENMTLSQPAPTGLSQPAPPGLAQAMLRRTISENSSQSVANLAAGLHRSVSTGWNGLLTRANSVMSTISAMSPISIQRTETTSSTDSCFLARYGNGEANQFEPLFDSFVGHADLEYLNDTACPNESSVSLNVTAPQESEDGSESSTSLNGSKRW